MRPITPALVSAAVLLSSASAAGAQDARLLSWPGKTAHTAPVAEAPPYSPFMAETAGPARVNNRYSPRSHAAPAAGHTPSAPVYAPVYVPAPAVRAMPAPAVDYGPPVIPSVVKPAPVIAAAPVPVPPVAAQAAKPPPVPSAVAQSAKPVPSAAPVQAAAGPAAAVAGAPGLVRPASADGPRFYSVHREFGGTPDATWRSRPAGPATERLPSGFFSGVGAEQVEEEEPQDDAETRAAALRAAEKATKAKGRRR